MSFIWHMLKFKGLKVEWLQKMWKKWGGGDFTVIQARRCVKQKQQAITYRKYRARSCLTLGAAPLMGQGRLRKEKGAWSDRSENPEENQNPSRGHGGKREFSRTRRLFQ